MMDSPRHARARRGHPRLSPLRALSKTGMAGTSPAMTSQTMSAFILLLRLIEIAQVWRRLVLAGRHEQPVAAEIVLLLADLHLMLVLAADRLEPGGAALAMIGPRHRPRSRQGVVDHGDVVAQYVRVALVEIDALAHHRAVVLVERQATRVVAAWRLECTCFHHQRIVAAITAFPLADRVAGERRLDLLGPAPVVGEDAAQLQHRLALNCVGDLRRDDELEAAAIADHHARHAGRDAGRHRVVALSAGGLVSDAVLENLLIFRRQRCLLPKPE